MNSKQNLNFMTLGALGSVVPPERLASSTNIIAGYILKSLKYILPAIAINLLLSQYRRIMAYMEIGPYAVVKEVSRLCRMLQRILTDITRDDKRMDWYPLSFIDDPVPVRSSDNGHPRSGAVRDEARRIIRKSVNDQGRSIYEISPSEHADYDESSHQHYAVGDLYHGIEPLRPPKDSVIVGIDIDYYIEDMSSVLGYCNPAAFHTFNPITVAGSDADSPFTIENNEVNYRVGNGGRWKHKVWDWCSFGEFIKIEARDTWWPQGLLGFRKYHYYKVQHSRPWPDCKHRLFVWLIPQYSCWSSVLGDGLSSRTLSRITYEAPGKPGWNSVISHTDGITSINFGRQGETANVTLEKANFDVLMAMGSQQSLSSRMISMHLTDPITLSLTGQFYKGTLGTDGAANEIGQSASHVKVHWPSAMEADAAEISYRSYASPIVSDEAMVPMIKRWEALSSALDTRVTLVGNRTVPGARYRSYADEFVKLVVPTPGVGVPYTLEDTRDLLNKPSQAIAIKQIWDTADLEVRRLIEAFIKNEPTMKDGRIISSFADMRFLLKFSAYTLKFRDAVLHEPENSHWFFPGRTPQEISEKVVEFVSKIGEPIEGDFSNFDGTVSDWCQRNVMNAVYLRYFNGRYNKELKKYTDMLISCPARAKRFGFNYEAGVGVKSGSPTTCDLNTVMNAFIQYCSIRMTLPDLEPADAFRCIGPAFGDDMLTERRYQKNMIKVVNALGMKIKMEIYKPEFGLTFLARVYPDPYTTTTSFQDPLRTWRKLHLTARDPNVPLAHAAMDRLESYLTTDKYTPVTSDYCNMVIRNYKKDDDVKRTTRIDKDREKSYWLTQDGGAWPQKEEDVEMMWDVISNRTGIQIEVLRELKERLNAPNTTVWFGPPIEREEFGVYTNTILSDGTPSEMDPHKIQNAKENVYKRCARNDARTSGEPSRRDNRGTALPDKGSSEGKERPGRSSGSTRVSGSKGEEHHRQSPRQTQRRGIPGRGGGRTEGRPRGPDQETPRDAAVRDGDRTSKR